MRFHVLTLFPEMIEGAIRYGIMARALNRGLISVDLHNIRQFTHDRHATVDDYPYSGGPGMVMKPEPLFEAVETIRETGNMGKSAPVILLTPQGRVFKQAIAEELAQHPEMVLICGRYEGFDERVRQHLATDELSIGDYVLGGGEIAAMVVIEATSRLVPGVVGSPESPANDSFTTGLLQHPLYTRPSRFRDMDVPEILLSGNHAEVARWQRRESLKRTLARRPDLLAGLRPDQLSEDDRRFLETLIEVENQQESGT
jgi:tRNA (guanine37-N1)-methyltransferase